MLGGPFGSRKAKRRAVRLPGQSRWLSLRRYQDGPGHGGHWSLQTSLWPRCGSAGPRRRPTISRWGVVRPVITIGAEITDQIFPS